MWRDPLFIVVAFAVMSVVVILMIGIGGFAKGGDFNRKHANRIMRYRVYEKFWTASNPDTCSAATAIFLKKLRMLGAGFFPSIL